jgi:NTE family protein
MPQRQCQCQQDEARPPTVRSIVHLIYRSRHYEGHSKDFSRLTMEDHWRAGYYDAVRTLRHQEVLERPSHLEVCSSSAPSKLA